MRRTSKRRMWFTHGEAMARDRVIPNLCECLNAVVLCEKYDAFYCPDCGKWVEAKCNDLKCRICRTRPERAKIVK